MRNNKNHLDLAKTMRAMMKAFFVVAIVTINSLVTAQAQSPAVNPPAPSCSEDAYRHFDFWLGEWDVTGAGRENPTAISKISALHSGCVVLEEYTVNSGQYSGMSINFYDSVQKLWHQSWMATNGVPVYLEGGLNDEGAMVLSDESLEFSKLTGTINQVTWTPNDDGSVRQYWEASKDGGKSWTVVFDGHYVRKAGEVD